MRTGGSVTAFFRFGRERTYLREAGRCNQPTSFKSVQVTQRLRCRGGQLTCKSAMDHVPLFENTRNPKNTPDYDFASPVQPELAQNGLEDEQVLI